MAIHLPLTTIALLAQAAEGERDYKPILLWSLALIAALVAGLAVVTRVKRRLQATDEPAATAAAGFTLSDLRRLHKAGQMTDAEFERAKAKVIEAAKRAAERDRPAAAGADVAAPAPDRGPPDV